MLLSNYILPTQEERYHISELCKEGFSKAETAMKSNRHLSTISRELDRKICEKRLPTKMSTLKNIKKMYSQETGNFILDFVNNLMV